MQVGRAEGSIVVIMTRAIVASICRIIGDFITYENVGAYRHKAVCRCGNWESVPYERIGHADTDILTRNVWNHAFAHFRFTDPPTIALEYSSAIETGGADGQRVWGRRIPSVLFHVPPHLDVRFTAAACDAGTHGLAVQDAQQLALWVCLVQDTAAVACGMPDPQRVTCAEHDTWRTPAHLLAHHHAATPEARSAARPSAGRSYS